VGVEVFHLTLPAAVEIRLALTPISKVRRKPEDGPTAQLKVGKKGSKQVRERVPIFA
jgi:hypothetical protein